MIVLFIPTKRYKFLVYIYSIGVFLLLVLVLAKGKIAGNAQSWFDLGPFNLQPTEFAKTALILFMAVYYNNLSKKNSKNLTLYFAPLFLAIIAFSSKLLSPRLTSAILPVISPTFA